MNFNVSQYENCINKLSDSTLWLTFKKPCLVEHGCSIEEENLKFPEGVLRCCSYINIAEFL